MAPELDWLAALPSHPALRFSVLDRWCRKVGFRVLKHRGLLWSYYEPDRYSLERWCDAANRFWPSSMTLFQWLLHVVEKGLEHDVPLAKLASTRQIILLEKP
jgi:hypothetical protein